MGEAVKELVACLKRLLANEVTMYLMASGFHWNVEGDDFQQYHSFFGMIYDDVYGAIDPTAENIRKCGEYAPFTLPTLDNLREVEDKKVSSDPMEMLDALKAANDTVIDCLTECFKAASDAGEQGIANFIADRDGMHKKWRWMIEASSKPMAE